MSFKPGWRLKNDRVGIVRKAPSIIGLRGSDVNGKIALEEHFNLPEFSLPQYVNPGAMKEISRRLLDVSARRLSEMDAAGR